MEVLRIDAVRKRESAQKQLEKAESELSQIQKRVEEMGGAYFSSPHEMTLSNLALIFDQAKQKMELENDVYKEEFRLLRHLGVESRADAEVKLNSMTSSAVEIRLAKIDESLKEGEKVLEQRIAERQDALREIEAIDHNTNVTRIKEKQQSILLEISNKADRALALHLGLMSADRALAAYRDCHRSELLARTTEAFKAITSGEFLSLTTQPNINQSVDRLIAVRSNGASISVEEMSKGTRFQLYLALRLAGYHRFCSKVGSLPFIGDDIMETFDNDRTASVIYQLSEIAKYGQVLYFTHHRHLCDIAKNVSGNSVLIHEIPKRCC